MKQKHPLVEFAEEQLASDKQVVHLFPDDESERFAIEEFLSPNGRYPHAYVLACLMDRQIKAENAWLRDLEVEMPSSRRRGLIEYIVVA